MRWVPRADLGGYPMDRSMRLRIGHYLEGRAMPYLGLQVIWRTLTTASARVLTLSLASTAES